MVSDSALVNRLREILESADLDITTAGSIRRQLEEEFGISLNDRKAFIREQIDVFLQPQNEDPQPHQDEQEGEVEEEYDDDNDEIEEESVNVKQEEVDSNGFREGDEEQDEPGEEDNDGDRSKKQRSDKVDKIVKRKGSGFSKPCALSPQLQELVGVPELARTEVVKKIWAYIREKNLQNPENKKKIICDKTLRAIFQVDTVDMFKMNKLLTKHIWPVDTEDAHTVKSSPKERPKKQGRRGGLDEPEQKGKRQKGQTSGFLAPLRLSDALVEFFGTGEDALSRANVVKRMWQYIKENELQDPADKRIIICDAKLKELFKIDSFHGFTMTKLLSSHLTKAE